MFVTLDDSYSDSPQVYIHLEAFTSTWIQIHHQVLLIAHANQVHQTPTIKLSSKYLWGQPDNMSSGTVNINNEASLQYKTCQACLESHEKDTLVTLPCNHYWCRNCLSRACSNVRNENDLPIACDAECTVPKEVALEVLPSAESGLLESKFQELETPTRERFYCANRACGEFIPPIFQGINIPAKCEKCGQSTCKLCRALGHEGECAGPSEEDKQAFALIEKEHYQKCSKCCRVIERTRGCSHMTCYCGYEFCYHCGRHILECNGCGHLEPDITPNFTNNFADPDEPWEEMVEESLLSLRILQRPLSSAGLTSWFNFMLRNDGYRGPAIFLRNDTTREYILDPEGMPDVEELSVSDAALFSMFGTAQLQVHADGTATLFGGFEQSDQDDDDDEQEWDDEADWAM